ncbi:MAG: hypothetical protein HY235_12020 [Acidobacteria bacterium]|nr:hypothetical protein [Acidobacteriota bacterium]
MTFRHFNRRLHLYLALSLLPWFLMYGVSSLVFAHNTWFGSREGDPALWTRRFERSYDAPVPQGAQLREFGRRVLRDAGLGEMTEKASFGVYRPNRRQVDIFVYTFLHSMRLSYYVEEKRLVAEDRVFRFPQFLTGMHARGGFEQDGVWQAAWSVVVDIVCVGFLLWIATGIYMWWHLPGHRGWGWVAMAGGVVSFGVFLLRL